jgi:hypothetical protein
MSTVPASQPQATSPAAQAHLTCLVTTPDGSRFTLSAAELGRARRAYPAEEGYRVDLVRAKPAIVLEDLTRVMERVNAHAREPEAGTSQPP